MNQIPLRDIHLPEAIGIWPPAIGWWLLPLIFLLIAGVIYFLIQFRTRIKRKPAYKKIALAELARIKQNASENKPSIVHLREISTLLRRIALSYLPRENVASLTGEKWITQLNNLTTDIFFSNELGKLLSNAPYSESAEFNLDEIIKICEQWIQKLPDQTHKEGSFS